MGGNQKVLSFVNRLDNIMNHFHFPDCGSVPTIFRYGSRNRKTYHE
jgi:predicted metal-dependent RNase